MAKYIKQEMNDLDGKGEGRVYYRMEINRCMDFEELAKRMSYPGSGITPGEAVKVVSTLASEMAEAMAEGYSINIDEIGTFTPTIGVVRDKAPDIIGLDIPQRNARSLEVNGVNFKASKRLVHNIDRQCDLKRGYTSRVKHSPYTKEQRIELAREYLATHDMMHIADYAQLTGLGKTTAGEELRNLAKDSDSGIRSVGYGGHKVYMKA